MNGDNELYKSYYVNTCAVRLSYALNRSGFIIPNIPGTYAGANGLRYFINSQVIFNYLNTTFYQSSLSPRSSGYDINFGIIAQERDGRIDHVDILYYNKVGTNNHQNWDKHYIFAQ